MRPAYRGGGCPPSRQSLTALPKNLHLAEDNLPHASESEGCMTSQDFHLGQMVALRADPSRRGPVVALLPAVAGRSRYSVFQGNDVVRTYYEDQLVAIDAPPTSDVHAAALAAGAVVSAREFRARLTAARLSHPLVDTLYALQAARVQFIPFQFKPLLRFLRADRQRLLISDDVGVGKTIEAGLILKELETRQSLDNVLVVCPKALVSKWRSEMRRFDEDFRVLTADTLRYCLRETSYDGAWPAQFSRAIAPLELLRIERYLIGNASNGGASGMLTLEPPPQFGLLIVDEAHHLRNPESNSNELARFLCDVSEAVLFLTATPVHLGSRDLFILLNMLRPDVFRDEEVFRVVVEPNRYLTEAMRYLRAGLPPEEWMRLAAGQLRRAEETEWGRRVLTQDPRFASWLSRLELGDPLNQQDRVRATRDLEEVHTLALVMNRTRRRDIGRFTIREPHTVAVPFTEPQEQLYRALIEFRRQVLSLRYDPRVVRLVIDTLERQASSCLAALVPALDGFFRHGRFVMSDVTDVEEESEAEWNLPSELLDAAKQLRQLARALPPVDPKLERFLELVREANLAPGPKKTLVFSFFLHTLAYLEAHLAEAGFRVALVTGRVADEDRERLRERFRLPVDNPEAIDVLLSSEVGCEGLDYEFCDRLINYDLPWNPMRVEQRIGRVDRFGQQSEKVLIFNFITPGTVEERIFHRCFERLGIFRETVGDLEEVLGELVQGLNRLVFDPALSLQQAEERAQQLADNVVREAEERRRLEAEGDILMGVDRAIEQEVHDLIDEGRAVSPDDLRLAVEVFISRPDVAGRLLSREADGAIVDLRMPRDGRRSLLRRLKGTPRPDRVAVEFQRWLESENDSLAVTFSQDAAMQHRSLPFITPVHSLAKVAVSELNATSSPPLVACLSVIEPNLPPGRYLFSCELREMVAARPEVRLASFAIDLATGVANYAVSDRLLDLLRRADTDTNADIPDETPELFSALDELVLTAHRKDLALLSERNDALLNLRLANLETYHRQRRDRVAADLQQATEPRIRRMRQSELARIERDHAASLEELDGRRAADIIGLRVAAGLLRITGSGTGG